MEKIVSKSFWSKYYERYQQLRSQVCIGLDSQLDKLPQCLDSARNPIWEFNRAIIDATRDYATAYKPNLAFYLADGVRGLEALYQTVQHIPAEIPVILDCKVGDIGSTMAGYVTAFFKDLKVDAITINPLMGSDVLKPLLELEHSFAFALALTSNPSAEDFFHKVNMKQQVADWINGFDPQRIGAVVGATQSSDLAQMRKLLPGRIFLIPGVGAQGGDLQAVLQHAIHSKAEPRILINSSRGIIFAGKGNDFAAKAAEAARDLYLSCKDI